MVLRGAALVALIALIGASSPLANSTAVIETACAHHAALPDFTFHAAVAVKMRRFPWLAFHLVGEGRYDRGSRYLIHFAQLPWFASKVHDIDLSMLDPLLWPKEYVYSAAGFSGNDAIYDLRALNDPMLVRAQVGLTPEGPDWVDATYSEGTHIHMNVDPGDVNGFRLPSKLNLAIDYRRTPLSASAVFTDYQFASGAP